MNVLQVLSSVPQSSVPLIVRPSDVIASCYQCLGQPWFR